MATPPLPPPGGALSEPPVAVRSGLLAWHPGFLKDSHEDVLPEEGGVNEIPVGRRGAAAGIPRCQLPVLWVGAWEGL